METNYIAPIHRAFVSYLTERTFALAALREVPQRSGLRTDERVRVGSRGQNTSSVYMNFRQRAIKAGKRQSKVKEDFARLQSWLTELRLSQEIEISSWRDLVDLRASVGTGRRSSESIVDIGVGFSQALPILVQLAVMPEFSPTLLLLSATEIDHAANYSASRKSSGPSWSLVMRDCLRRGSAPPMLA